MHDILKRLILQKLIRANMWGGKHTPFDFVCKGVPNGWLIIHLKRTGKGSDEHVSLNQKKVSEIKQFLEMNA